MNKLNQPIFQPKCKEHYNIAHSTKRMYDNLIYSFLYFSLQTYLFFAIQPFFRREKSMLSDGWFPCDWKISPNYEIIFAFQNFVIFSNTFTCITLDILSAGLLIQIGLQCDYLVVTLNCLEKFSVENGILRQRDESSVDLNDKDFQTFSRVMTSNLIVCIEHYKQIKTLSKEIEKFHETSIFVLFFGGEVLICCSLYQMSVVPIMTIEFFMVISFVIAALMEQFVYCWFGNDIIHKSSKISDAIYNTPWIECDLQYKKILLNFLIQTKFPIEIWVGRLFSMSIPVFKWIVQSSYSGFALLKNVQDKKN
ncbi:putative odorant receptor 71a [Leptinotarsa decemlineata]|uniref:putative odorant receptor 71a n=1 Tax=Leptinotarsa decemlineata TaxID=7539 RepID=UPI003D306D9A